MSPFSAWTPQRLVGRIKVQAGGPLLAFLSSLLVIATQLLSLTFSDSVSDYAQQAQQIN